MATLFENILQNAQRKGVAVENSRKSIDWFRTNVRKTTRNVASGRLIREERANLVNSWMNVSIGKMYFVYYDPKWKKELPYYDSFPLIIPIHRYTGGGGNKSNGLLGLNLHYLPPILRARLLDALYDTLTNENFDERTKMRINYGILKSASKFEEFKPCIKRYLGHHFRSRFIMIPPEKWTPAVFLPVESFEKQSKTRVWADSRKIIKG